MKTHPKDFTATVKATNEKIVVYRLANGNYYDSMAIGADAKPSAHIANKKEFTPDELIIHN